MNRPELDVLDEGDFNVSKTVAGFLANKEAQCLITMSVGQWDGYLQSAYDYGWVLIELDDNEEIVRAYKKKGTNKQEN